MATKTLYHSELRTLSPLTVKVIKERQESKFKKGNEYVVISIEGEERTYNAENAECAAAFDGYEGCVLTLDADGGGKGKEETATVTIDTDSVERGGEAPAKKPVTAQPQAQQARPKGAATRPAAPAARQETPSESNSPGDDNGHQNEPETPRAPKQQPSMKQRALQVANLQLVALAASKAMAEQATVQLGWTPSDEQIGNNAMNITIELMRERAHWELSNSAWVDVRPKQKLANDSAK